MVDKPDATLLEQLSKNSWQRGYIKDGDDWREETDAELRERIRLGIRKTPGLGAD